jgi:hypothetical protein
MYLLSFLASLLLFAQAADPGPVSFSKQEEPTANEKSAASATEGSALLVLFQEGLPKEGYALTIAGKSYRTDADGVIRLRLPAGSYTFQSPDLESPGSFTLAPGEETEVLINLLPPSQFRSEAKTPETTSTLPSLREARGNEIVLQIYSEETKAPLTSASVVVSGFADSLSTNSKGEIRLQLPEGNYVFSILDEKHETQFITDAVGPTGLAKLRNKPIFLKRSVSDLEEFVVLAPKVKGSVSALVEVRKNSAAVAEVLGSEQMAKQGDSDAGASLRRVTGLSLVGGKYVYVRGLGERYSAVTLNGSSLPSPDPSRRVIPLDIFPTSVLESVVVQKSFSPPQPGEFGGGLIQLQTKSLPDKTFLRVSTGATLEGQVDQILYQGGSTDWLGIDDGTRALPDAIRSALASGKKLNENNPPLFTNGFSTEELDSLGRSLPLTYNTTNGQRTNLPSLSLSGGTRANWHDLSFGVSASGSHSTGLEQTEKKSFRYDADSPTNLTLNESSIAKVSEREVKSSGTLDLGASNKNHGAQVSLLLVRHSTDEAEIRDSTRTSDSVSSRRITNLEWVERELFTKQISANHQWSTVFAKPLQLRWRLSESIAQRSAPDAKQYVYEERLPGIFTLGRDNNGNRRIYSELKDQSQEIGGELRQDFSLTEKIQWGLYAGATVLQRDRAADVWRLHMRLRNPNIDLTGEPNSILGQIGADGFQLTNLTESADSMSAEQTIRSFYVGTELQLPSWVWSSGFRQEKGRQEVKTFYYFDRQSPTSKAGLETLDLLPAHSLTWKPSDAVRARIAYSETTARPEFRELSTVPFIDNESGYETVGYDKLRGTVIKNYDHRWEFYPSPEESFSIGVFHKEFSFPIEEVFEPSPNLRKTFRNVDLAKNSGLELDGRLDLRRISRFLRRWSVLGNVSLIRSRVVLGEEARGQQTSENRPLQGQSPWVINAQAQYDRPQQGSAFGLVYNVVGPRITEVGTNFRPDIYEQPFHQLDFVGSQKFAKNYAVNFRAKNLLDPEARSLQGEKLVRTQKKGRSFHVSLSASF